MHEHFISLAIAERKYFEPGQREGRVWRTDRSSRKNRDPSGQNYGGVRAIPVGVIEVSEQQTRFVPISDRKKMTGAILFGVGLGMWLGWRRRR